MYSHRAFHPQSIAFAYKGIIASHTKTTIEVYSAHRLICSRTYARKTMYALVSLLWSEEKADRVAIASFELHHIVSATLRLYKITQTEATTLTDV